MLFISEWCEMLYLAISFIFLIVDLLWNTADKYKDPNEPNKSAE